MAITVICGLTPTEVGKTLASQTKRFLHVLIKITMSTNERLAKTTELNIKMQLIVALLGDAVKLKVCLILLFFHCIHEVKSSMWKVCVNLKPFSLQYLS